MVWFHLHLKLILHHHILSHLQLSLHGQVILLLNHLHLCLLLRRLIHLHESSRYHLLSLLHLNHSHCLSLGNSLHYNHWLCSNWSYLGLKWGRLVSLGLSRLFITIRWNCIKCCGILNGLFLLLKSSVFLRCHIFAMDSQFYIDKSYFSISGRYWVFNIIVCNEIINLVFILGIAYRGMLYTSVYTASPYWQNHKDNDKY